MYEKLQFNIIASEPRSGNSRTKNFVQGSSFPGTSSMEPLSFGQQSQQEHCSGNKRTRNIVQGTMVHGRRAMSQSLRDGGLNQKQF